MSNTDSTPDVDRIVRKIETFCKKRKMSLSRFGRNAARNPNLVQRIRNRTASLATMEVALKYIENAQ